MRHYFLAEDLAALDERIQEILGIIREAGLQMGQACEEGAETFHDNFGWEDGDRRMRMWTRRYRELVRVRELALVVEPSGDPDVVRIGRKVRFRELHSGREREVLVGSHVVFTTDRISCTSPLATGQLVQHRAHPPQLLLLLGGRRRVLRTAPQIECRARLRRAAQRDPEVVPAGSPAAPTSGAALACGVRRSRACSARRGSTGSSAPQRCSSPPTAPPAPLVLAGWHAPRGSPARPPSAPPPGRAGRHRGVHDRSGRSASQTPEGRRVERAQAKRPPTFRGGYRGLGAK